MDAEMESEAYSELTAVQRFFFGRSVFVTGATGLIGKVLVEKLLRCCPGIGQIFLLMRPKRGLPAEQRLDRIFNCPLFGPLSEAFPGYRSKVTIVDGDLEQERLGISDEQFQAMRHKVSVVFHSAARVRFDDPLRIAAQNNLIATGHVLDLCKELPNIAVVVHVSTAYVHRNEDYTVPECITRCEITTQQMLSALEWMDDETLVKVTPQLLKVKNNTYLFTKALAENMVQEQRGDMPTAIVRPCNITSTWKDPFPGWIDTIQGPSGIFLAAAKGFLRTLYSVPDLRIVLVPVDVVVNTMISSAWHVATEKPEEIFVVNCTPEYDKAPLGGEAMLKEVMKNREKMPLVNMYRYPDFTLYYSYSAYVVHAFFDQWLPAFFFDFLIFIATGKTLMLRLYRKIDFLYGIFLAIGTKPWISRVENFKALGHRLSERDSEIFFVDMDNLDWMEYIDICLAGGRKFLAKEDPSNIPYAKKKAKIWYFVTTFLKWGLILLLIYKLLPAVLLERLCFGWHDPIHSS